MRTDLYGSLETISEKVSHTINTMDPIPKKKGIPKIISNMQLVPPRPMPRETETLEESDYCTDGKGWIEMKHRRGKKSVKIDNSNVESMEVMAPAVGDNRSMKRPPFAAPVPCRRAPRAAAVAINANAEGVTYADIIKRAKESVNLKDLGIVNPRMRRAANGGVIIEIVGPEGALKTDSFREVIGSSALVSRPVVRADVRISGFDDSVIKDKLITIITELLGQ